MALTEKGFFEGGGQGDARLKIRGWWVMGHLRIFDFPQKCGDILGQETDKKEDDKDDEGVGKECLKGGHLGEGLVDGLGEVLDGGVGVDLG